MFEIFEDVNNFRVPAKTYYYVRWKSCGYSKREDAEATAARWNKRLEELKVGAFFSYGREVVLIKSIVEDRVTVEHTTPQETFQTSTFEVHDFCRFASVVSAQAAKEHVKSYYFYEIKELRNEAKKLRSACRDRMDELFGSMTGHSSTI